MNGGASKCCHKTIAPSWSSLHQCTSECSPFHLLLAVSITVHVIVLPSPPLTPSNNAVLLCDARAQDSAANIKAKVARIEESQRRIADVRTSIDKVRGGWAAQGCIKCRKAV